MVVEPPPWLGAAQSWPRAPRDGDDVAVPPRCLLRSAPGAAARATHAFLGVRSLAALLETRNGHVVTGFGWLNKWKVGVKLINFWSLATCYGKILLHR